MTITAQTAPTAAALAPIAPWWSQALAWAETGFKTLETDVEVDFTAIEPAVISAAEGIIETFLGAATTAAVGAFQNGLTGQEHFSQVKVDVTQAIEASGKTAANSTINAVVSIGTALAGMIAGQVQGVAVTKAA